MEYFLQEEENEGIQMITTVQQNTPVQVKQNFIHPIVILMLLCQPHFVVLRSRQLFNNVQERQRGDSLMTISPDSLVSSQVNEISCRRNLSTAYNLLTKLQLPGGRHVCQPWPIIHHTPGKWKAKACHIMLSFQMSNVVICNGGISKLFGQYPRCPWFRSNLTNKSHTMTQWPFLIGKELYWNMYIYRWVRWMRWGLRRKRKSWKRQSEASSLNEHNHQIKH